MSRTVTIPSTAMPFTCEVNGIKYTYEAGSTQTVPDEVAAIIDAQSEFPPEAPTPEAPFAGLSLVSGGGINITWDGSTEGRDTFDLIGMSLYKVAGGFLSVDELTGCELTLNDSTTYTLDEELISIVVPNKLISCGDSIVSCIAGTYELPVSASEVATIIIPSDGVYFMEVETHGQVLRPTSLTKSAPSKLMQNGEDVTQEVKGAIGGMLIVNAVIADDNSSATVDKSFTAIADAFSNGKNVVIHAKYESEDVVYPTNIISAGNDEFIFQSHFMQTDENGGIEGLEVYSFDIRPYSVEFSYGWKSLT